jgi:hypothetical protein
MQAGVIMATTLKHWQVLQTRIKNKGALREKLRQASRDEDGSATISVYGETRRFSPHPRGSGDVEHGAFVPDTTIAGKGAIISRGTRIPSSIERVRMDGSVSYYPDEYDGS